MNAKQPIRTTPTASNRTVVLALFAMALILLIAAGASLVIYFVMLGSHRPDEKPAEVGVSYLDKVLGLDRIDGIEEEGFSYVETSKTWGGDQYRWTLGHAKLVVPLIDRPQSLQVRLGVPISRKVPLRIQINDKILFDEIATVTGDWTRTFDHSTMNLGDQATIEIISDTFIPAEKHKDSTDRRTLGVCVRGITLLSGAQEFMDVNLGARPAAGVSEEGFHHQEKAADQPCRWTNGKAVLDVPIRAKTPKSLALSLDVPNRPNYRIQISVNGRKLFDDEVQWNANWSMRLPLDEVDVGKNARIEVVSSTFVPASSIKGSTDNRTLGVRVKEVMLSAEKANK
jgi:hypothetical protein